MRIWQKILRYAKEYGWRYTVKKIWFRFMIKYYSGKRNYPFSVTDEEKACQKKFCEADGMPMVSIIVPVYNVAERYFEEMLQSVRNQTYSLWELCLADGSEQDNLEKIAEKYSARDARIKYCHLQKNGGISENTNQALNMAGGEYIALLDHDDLLHPSALYWTVKEMMEKDMDFVYTDELSFVKKPSIVQSIHFKSDFHWESFRNNNYICHFSMFRRELINRAGGFRKEFDGAQDYDLFLRMAELTNKISHIPKVLYYWRLHSDSSASGLMAKPYVTAAGRGAIQQHLGRMGIAGKVTYSEALGPYYHIKYQLSCDLRILVLVEDKDIIDILRDCMECRDFLVEIKSKEAEMRDLEMYDRIILVRSGYLPENLNSQWLEEILECLQTGENQLVGVATCDHKGKYIQAGFCWNTGWHERMRPLYCGVPVKDPAYMNRLLFRQNVGVLGGAVLGMSGKLFLKWQKKMAGNDIFAEEQWFKFSMTMSDGGKECVLSPCIRWRYAGRKAAGIDTSWMEGSEMEQLGRDKCCHPDMRGFGKMYFLWKN